ncbi:hypothetical protein ACFL40_01085 [candidate division KSB1 bacterium]
MKNINRFFLIFITGFMFAFLVNSKTYSQMKLATASHNLGKLKFTWESTHPYRTVGYHHYPSGYYQSDLDDSGEWIICAIENFVGGAGSEAKPTIHMDWDPIQTRELWIVRKHAPPSVKVDGVEVIPPYQGLVDEDLDADSYMEKWIINSLFPQPYITGYYYRLKSRAYTNQNHDDYIIFEGTQGRALDYNEDGVDDVPAGQELNEWFGWGLDLSPGYRARRMRYHRGGDRNRTRGSSCWRWFEWVPITFPAGAPRGSLPISFAHDADIVSVQKPPGWDNAGVQGDFEDQYAPKGPETGGLNTINCEFMAPQWCGYATLHADKSKDDASDDIEMPRQAMKYSLSNWQGDILQDHYQLVNTFPLAHNMDIREDEMGFADPTLWGGGRIGMQYQFLGPYFNMTENDDFHWVWATGVGTVDEALCREKAVDYMNWYRDGTGNFDVTAKNNFIGTGRDSLLTVLSRAYWNYHTKNYDIPDPLPAPDISVISGPGKIVVDWEYPSADYFKDTDTGNEDFKEWRLYRKLGNFEVWHEADNGYKDYELIGTFPKGTTSYDDNNVILGEAYHYCVTALDDGSQYNAVGDIVPGPMSLESSYYVNRTPADAIAFRPGEDTSDDVLIVPNPYSLSTGITNAMNWTGSTNDIHFVNLPAYCTLKIYTATGDLLKTIEHTSGSGQEIWWDMRTDSNQAPVSGVYILVVDNARNSTNSPLPKKLYKFVIVR